MKRTTTHEMPDILARTTLGRSLVAMLILIPFTINNYIQDRYFLSLATPSVAAVCAVDFGTAIAANTA